MQSGKINVQTENIFPIIKKFLYSESEIFLRELISNAVDATQKLMALSRSGKYTDEIGDTRIKVLLDKEKGTLTVRDHGIGMTADEVDKYINQIAFSSAEEFIKKVKKEDASNLIGHFGLGFYSSFMVADKVEIFTKTYKKGGQTKPVHWECDGTPNYSIEEIEDKERGTDVVLHISEDHQEYLEEQRIKEILDKYCKFLPIEIEFGTEKVQEETGEKDENGEPKTQEVEKPRVINNTEPAWRKSPGELTEEDYKNFYRELYPSTFEEPLFHIHLNVDYPFNLTGILYFPKVKQNLEVQRNKIQLYSNQVFVTDSVEGVVPDFLTLLHGVLDSPDIPLNVSRTFLQSDANVKKISKHITKKVADKLEELFKKDRQDFEKKWDDIKIFIEYGMISETDFYERAEKFALLKNSEGKFFTFEEYKHHIKENQTDKDDNLVYLYTTDTEAQHSYITEARDRGYDVLVFDTPIDSHFVNTLEQKFEKSSFARVDADAIDNLIKKEDERASKLSEEEEKKLKEIFEKFVDTDKFTVQLENMDEKAMPLSITQPEFMRRMKEMQQTGGMPMMGNMPDNYNMVVNKNHDLMGKILEAEDEEHQKRIVNQLKDLAMLSQNLLKGEALTNFIKRSVDIIE
ncbi:MAG: molecular chaperone HtpG [Bacteroidales bacterium]|nr:molecular chaperone HtpG [Bacteroidales bacterium]MCF8337806.1 molecular chaperone HtpG [Bacteroidales bacterium]